MGRAQGMMSNWNEYYLCSLLAVGLNPGSNQDIHTNPCSESSGSPRFSYICGAYYLDGGGGGQLKARLLVKRKEPKRRKMIRNPTQTILGRPCSLLPCDRIIIAVPRDRLGARRGEGKSHIEKSIVGSFVRTAVSSHDIVTCMSRGPLILGSRDTKVPYHIISYQETHNLNL